MGKPYIPYTEPRVFKTRIRYKRMRDIFKAAMYACGNTSYTVSDFDLNSIVGYETTCGLTFPGKPENCPKGWTFMEKNETVQAFEFPHRSNHQNSPAGVFMVVLYYPKDDEYTLFSMNVIATQSWYVGKYYFCDNFDITWNGEHPTVHPYHMNGTQESIWYGTFDSTHFRYSAYSLNAPSGRDYIQRKDRPHKEVYYKPSRDKAVTKYGKRNNKGKGWH